MPAMLAPGSRYAHAIARLACIHLTACLMELLPQNLGALHLFYLLLTAHCRLCSPVQRRPALLGSASHDLCTGSQGKQQCQDLKRTAAKFI